VLQTNNIHLKVCAEGEVTDTLAQLKASPATTKTKAKFVLATDCTDLEADKAGVEPWDDGRTKSLQDCRGTPRHVF